MTLPDVANQTMNYKPFTIQSRCNVNRAYAKYDGRGCIVHDMLLATQNGGHVSPAEY